MIRGPRLIVAADLSQRIRTVRGHVFFWSKDQTVGLYEERV